MPSILDLHKQAIQFTERANIARARVLDREIAKRDGIEETVETEIGNVEIKIAIVIAETEIAIVIGNVSGTRIVRRIAIKTVTRNGIGIENVEHVLENDETVKRIRSQRKRKIGDATETVTEIERRKDHSRLLHFPEFDHRLGKQSAHWDCKLRFFYFNLSVIALIFLK